MYTDAKIARKELDWHPKIKFKVVGKGVSSGVSDQPMGEKETFLGANNRVLGLLKDEANYYVGIEGGCCFIDKKLYAFAWVITRDDKKVGCGKTSLFQLPRKIQNLVDNIESNFIKKYSKQYNLINFNE